MDFKKERFSNKTHQSKTDPQCRLFRKGKGKEAKLRFSGHVVMDNRHGLVANDRLCQANGTAERDRATDMMIELNPKSKSATLGGDKNYDTQEFVSAMRSLQITPHVAQNNTRRKSAIDMRTTRHPGYEVSQRKRKLVEQVFSWDKATGRMDRLRHVGQAINQYLFTFTHAAYNLIRMTKLIPVPL